ncbi:MAG: IPExxxVDY family protein [Sphingobacteriales bacterium]|nr:MAG: IPExxxVDY family protein [Sphingobacteriales bacterium]TAF79433.1 MAG: IPExxxVDY family protein [Sphingobacteriales bacterium]
MNKKFLKLELDLDFCLIAIISPLKGYRLCFLINKFLSTNFERTALDYCLSYPNTKSKYFSQFYCTSTNDTDCYILSNKGAEGYLIPEMKQIDYFILLRHFCDKEELEFILERLKRIKEIQMAIEINPSSLKSKENLIF